MKDAVSNAISDNKSIADEQIRIDLPVYTTEEAAGETDLLDVVTSTTEAPQCGNSSEITDNTIDSNESEPCMPEAKEDNGVALILTPYLKENRTIDARNASRVNPEIFLGIESYSGFVTVNETYNSNIFFWYFPVENKPVNETPWLIWLQGGPGASSMTGLFDEIGPFFADPQGRLIRKSYFELHLFTVTLTRNIDDVGAVSITQ